jgi:hypothetical protein
MAGSDVRWWAAPSIPNARPDTTVASAATRAVAIRPAVVRPEVVARRVPTMATARSCDSAAGSPVTKSTCGGMATDASLIG